MDIKLIPLFQNSSTRSSRVIHTPSSFARNSLVHLQEVGHLQALVPHVSRRNTLSSYLFFIVTNGEGTLTYDGIAHPLHRHDCVFIDCRRGYTQGASDHRNNLGEFDQLWGLSWVHFSGPTMSAIYEKYKERGGQPVFSTTQSDKYLGLIQAIQDIVAESSYTCDMQIAEKLTALLSLLMEDAWNSEQEHAAPKRRSAGEVKAYLDENYPLPLSLEGLAKQFYINKQYLARIFKEQYGSTVKGYLTQVRITKAKGLLRFSDKSVEEIGEIVGIPDPNYFARIFKKIEGLTPSQYRKSWY